MVIFITKNWQFEETNCTCQQLQVDACGFEVLGGPKSDATLGRSLKKNHSKWSVDNWYYLIFMYICSDISDIIWYYLICSELSISHSLLSVPFWGMNEPGPCRKGWPVGLAIPKASSSNVASKTPGRRGITWQTLVVKWRKKKQCRYHLPYLPIPGWSNPD